MRLATCRASDPMKPAEGPYSDTPLRKLISLFTLLLIIVETLRNRVMN